eukprot:snap_masked-scaffold_20-processed-gene-5.93-mRNA-1 protein AED:1.00 eAED:1.00 QI:0/-1/0/0/-1/1/1/0/410
MEDLDIEELRGQLRKYYHKWDPEEIENIDDVIDLGIELGLPTLNSKLKLFYGESLDEFLYSLNNLPKGISKLRANAQAMPTRLLPSPNSFQVESAPGYQVNGRQEQSAFGGGMEFEPLLSREEEIELRGLLQIFYEKHDPERLAPEKMEQILKVGRQMGIQGLNEKLIEYYDEGLYGGRNPRPAKSVNGAAEESSSGTTTPKKQTKRKKVRKRKKQKKGSGSLRSDGSEEKGEPETNKPFIKPSRSLLADNDEKNLRNDLTLFYQNFDPDKLAGIDDVIEIGLSIGIEALDDKLGELYGMGFIHFKRYKEAKEKEKKSNEKRQPFALPGIQEVGKVKLRKINSSNKQSLKDLKKKRRRGKGTGGTNRSSSRRATSARHKLQSVRVNSLQNDAPPTRKSYYVNITDLRNIV